MLISPPAVDRADRVTGKPEANFPIADYSAKNDYSLTTNSFWTARIGAEVTP
jgi:hypothetical protein